MGTSESKDLSVFDPNDLRTWRLAQAERVFEAFASQNYDFGLDKAHLDLLLSSTVPGISTLADELWDAFSHVGTPMDGRAMPSMVNALEVMVALGAACVAPLSAKLHFAFAVFDVDESLELGRDEAVVMLSSCLAALARLSAVGAPPPDDAEGEVLAAQLFTHAGKGAVSAVAPCRAGGGDDGATVSARQFEAWGKESLARNLAARGMAGALGGETGVCLGGVFALEIY